MKRFLIKKKIAVVLSVIFFANVLNISPADINFAYAARKILKNKSIKREQSFFQKNPRLAKILKYFGISSAILISIFGLSYFVDKLNEKEKSECPHYKDMKELKNSIDSQINEAFKEVVVNKEDKERRDKKILDLVKDKKLVIELLEEAKKEAKLEEKPKNIKNVFIHLSVIGGLITIISGIRNAISEIGKLSKDIMQISYMRWAAVNIMDIYSGFTGLFQIKEKCVNKEDVLKKYGAMTDRLYGQEEALSKTRNYILDIIMRKKQAEKEGIKLKECPVLMLYGPSGSGKSSLAMIIASILSPNLEPFIINSSSIDKSVKGGTISNLLKSSPQNSERLSVMSPLAKFITGNQGKGYIVLICDEYHMWNSACRNPDDKLSDDDESIRNISDTGTITVNGQVYDCDNLIIIMISNGSRESMEGLDNSKKENFEISKKSFDEGYVRVYHSPSFLNRLRMVEFKSLKFDAYLKIVIDNFNSISNYWSDPENGSIRLCIDDETLKVFAEKAEKIGKGARVVSLTFFSEIQNKILEKVNSAPSGYFENKLLNILYDKEKDVITLEEKVEGSH